MIIKKARETRRGNRQKQKRDRGIKAHFYNYNNNNNYHHHHHNNNNKEK